MLEKDEIFVFGSNLAGKHLGGAAKAAYNKFGAQWGVGVGLTGQAYAIPTMQGGVETIKPYVDEFIEFAQEHQGLKFLVTPVGAVSLDILQKKLLLCLRMQLIWRMCIYPSVSGRC